MTLQPETQVDLAETVRYYQDKLRAFGPGPEGMDWKNGETQNLRFEVISRHIDFRNSPSLLDVGCGSGEFKTFCDTRGLPVDYWGIDVCPEMIAACHARFSEPERFLVASGASSAPAESYDYVVASGTFNARLGTEVALWREYFHAQVIAMYRVCRIATIVNMMSPYVDYTYDRLYYPTLEEIPRLAVQHCTRDVTIDHSYPLYEMTIVLHKQRPGIPRSP